MIEFLTIFPLLAAGWADHRSRTIPDLCWVGLLILGLFSPHSPLYGLLSAVALGGLLLLGGVCIGGIGGGDIKLCAALAVCVGFLQSVELLLLSLLLLYLFGRIARKHALPFAPFLCVSYLFYFFKELI